MKKVVVLMSTYNGSRYLAEQLESILSQKGVEVELFIRDDGSQDDTHEVLKQFCCDFIAGENLGYVSSFMWLLKNAPDADYYALCDQDDVWDDDKLRIAVSMLDSIDCNGPKLYTGNARLVDADLKFIVNENKNPKVSLGSSMAKNFATGCTVVINRDLLNIIKMHDVGYVSSHDTYLCRVCLAVGGTVVFDDIPHINYRQHSNNTVGSKNSVFGKLKSRIRKLKNDKSHSRMRTAEELITIYGNMMKEEDKELLCVLLNYNKSFLNKLQLIRDKRFSTGNNKENLMFKLAVILNWI